MILTDNGKILMSADGKIYAGGYGLSNAKLVARGKPQTTTTGGGDIGYVSTYVLDNNLQPNKVYLVTKYDDTFGDYFAFIISTSIDESGVFRCYTTPTIAIESDNDTYIVVQTRYISQNNSISIGNENLIYANEEDILEVYELPFKVGETQSSASSGDNIKTVEIKGVFADAWIDFIKENLLIDSSKNFKFEIYNGNELLGRYIVYIDEDGKVMCYDILNNTRDLLTEILYESSYEFYYGFDNSGMVGTFYITISQNTFEELYGVSEYDNIKLKLYYVEANELTAPFIFEV